MLSENEIEKIILFAISTTSVRKSLGADTTKSDQDYAISMEESARLARNVLKQLDLAGLEIRAKDQSSPEMKPISRRRQP